MIYMSNKNNIKPIIAHPNAVHDLKVHPVEADLVLSASKDYSIRLWNIRTEALVVIFSGIEAHRDQVVTISFDTLGNKVLSAGIDHTIKIWHLDKPVIKTAIQKSKYYNRIASGRQFKTITEPYPFFSSDTIHDNYIDCIKWFGDFVLSKVYNKKTYVGCFQRIHSSSFL